MKNFVTFFPIYLFLISITSALLITLFKFLSVILCALLHVDVVILVLLLNLLNFLENFYIYG